MLSTVASIGIPSTCYPSSLQPVTNLLWSPLNTTWSYCYQNQRRIFIASTVFSSLNGAKVWTNIVLSEYRRYRGVSLTLCHLWSHLKVAHVLFQITVSTERSDQHSKAILALYQSFSTVLGTIGVNQLSCVQSDWFVALCFRRHVCIGSCRWVGQGRRRLSCLWWNLRTEIGRSIECRFLMTLNTYKIRFYGMVETCEVQFNIV